MKTLVLGLFAATLYSIDFCTKKVLFPLHLLIKLLLYISANATLLINKDPLMDLNRKSEIILSKETFISCNDKKKITHKYFFSNMR